MNRNEDDDFNPSFIQQIQKDTELCDEIAVDDVNEAIEDTDNQLDEIDCFDESAAEMDAHVVQIFSIAFKQMSLAELDYVMDTYGNSLRFLIEQEMANRL